MGHHYDEYKNKSDEQLIEELFSLKNPNLPIYQHLTNLISVRTAQKNRNSSIKIFVLTIINVLILAANVLLTHWKTIFSPTP